MHAKSKESNEQQLIEHIKASIQLSLKTEELLSAHGITRENLHECLIEPTLERYWYDYEYKERKANLRTLCDKITCKYKKPEIRWDSIEAYTVLIERPNKLNMGYSIFYFPENDRFGLGEYDLTSRHEICHWPDDSFCQVIANM